MTKLTICCFDDMLGNLLVFDKYSEMCSECILLDKCMKDIDDRVYPICSNEIYKKSICVI